jgi:hypothetical protein
MSESSFAPDATDAEKQDMEAPAASVSYRDPYGDVALGVECAWPMALAD